MPKRRDDETGKFEENISDDEIVDILQETRLSTSEVAEEIGYHRTTTYDRLVTLEEEGLIEASKVGNTYIWEADD